MPSKIGRYEIVDLIGRGDRGALYRARDLRIGRQVAIKQLRPDFDTPEQRDCFFREAAAAGSLSHPNIVTILDVGEDEGLPFIAMEYVQGETFTEVLGLRPPLSVLRKLQLVEEVCAGLAHAHEAGIVHRDIKPTNLMVSSEGIVKILDFGIAKLSSLAITLFGLNVGNFNYMAPEQVRGETVDARADIFAVGAVLYELLTHRPAFPGNASSEVLDKILRGTPAPIAEVYPDVDPRLVELVALALEKDRDRRIQEVAFLQRELAKIRLKPSVGEPRLSSTRTTGSSHRQTGLVTPPSTPVTGSGPSSSDRNRASMKAQIEEHLIAAEREFNAGNHDAAIESCKRVLMLDDSDERAIAQLDRIHAAFHEQQARADLAAQEREAQERLNADIDDARRRFAKGDHQTAVKMLEALDPSSREQVRDALMKLRTELLEIEHHVTDRSTTLPTASPKSAASHRATSFDADSHVVRPSENDATSIFASAPMVIDAPSTRKPLDIKSRFQSLWRTRRQIPPNKLPRKAPRDEAIALDENVQFTVYRPSAVVPERWYQLLAFAHLTARRADASADEPDPVEEVSRQAQQVLGQAIDAFQAIVQDSAVPIPQYGRLRLVPDVEGVEFNPSERSFVWREAVHREEFRLRAIRTFEGRVTRGVVSVYLGRLLVAEIAIAIRVDSSTVANHPVATSAQRFRRIFASYSHLDTAVVEEIEDHVVSLGDKYLRDVTELRSGEQWGPRIAEMITGADVFQLFWSTNAMRSTFVRAEWEHALTLRRREFIRPVYWEDPFPSTSELPPASLSALHFRQIHPRSIATIHKDEKRVLPKSSGVARLVVFRGDAVENEIRLSGCPVRIGRHAGNDVVLDDSLNGVSRFHAEIRPEGNSYVIVDLNSRNGVWIGGKRIKDKAALLLGVPVTVGAFELALEDDPSGTFDGHAVSPRTVATVPLGDTGSSASSRISVSSASRSGAPVSASRSTPRPRVTSSLSSENKRILSSAGALIGVLAICVVTYTVLRRVAPQPPPQVAQVELPPTTTVSPPVETPAPPPEDPNKALNEQDLQAARDMIAAGNLRGALREHVQPILERDPENTIALDLKRTTEETLAARAAKPKPTPKPEAPAEPETPGIARKTGEVYAEYQARVRGIQVNMAEGRAALDKGEYAVGLARLRLVERDAPSYQGVSALIADGTAKQQAAVDKAIDSGQQSETAKNLMSARRWYEQALQINPSSVIAREKREAVALKMNQAAGDLFAQGTAALKTGNTQLAKRIFQQIYDSTLPGDEFRDKAAKQLEVLK
jgi:serine/threonine protein kinase